MPQRDNWWCIIVAKYGAFLFTENGAVVITDYKREASGFVKDLSDMGDLIQKKKRELGI